MSEKVIEKDINTIETESADVKTTRKSTTKKTKTGRTVDDVSLNERVAIDNLCDWSIGFMSEETGKAVLISPHVKNYKKLSVAEVDSQVRIGNVAFVGTDGYGSHAAIRIQDPVIREYVFGEDISPMQLTEEAVSDLLACENKLEFENKLSDLVVTDSEKRMIAIMCSNKEAHPSIDLDSIPAYMIASIEKISGLSIV